MSILHQCQFTPHQKALLKSYLQHKVKDETTPEKNTFRIALANIDGVVYLPSWKLINHLRAELTESEQPDLKAGVEHIHKIYSESLQPHI